MPDKQSARKFYEDCQNYLHKRLKLSLSKEKSRIVNTRKTYSNFLGFKIKVHQKGFVERKAKKGKRIRIPKYVVLSHMSDQAKAHAIKELRAQIQRIRCPKYPRTRRDEIVRFNAKVSALHSYFHTATEISIDCGEIHRKVFESGQSWFRIGAGPAQFTKEGRDLKPLERDRYGRSKQLMYDKKSGEPLYPIAFIQTKHPMHKSKKINRYTVEGRAAIHDNLKLNTTLLWQLGKQPSHGRSLELLDNRLALFSSQKGRCAISGLEFENTSDIHCHHIVPKAKGGKDTYQNLVLVMDGIHKLIHATDQRVINKLLKTYDLSDAQIAKLNKYRAKAGLDEVNFDFKFDLALDESLPAVVENTEQEPASL